MKIKVDDFGYRTPGGGNPQVGPASFVTTGVQELGQAGQRVGAELSQDAGLDAQMAYREAHEKRVEAETVAKEAKRAEAMTIHARAQNALADAHDQLAVGIQNGSVAPDAAPKVWADTSQKIVDTHLKTVDKSNAELVRAALVGNVGTFGRSINEEVTKRNRQQIGASLMDYREQMERFALTDQEGAKKQYFTALDAQGPLAGLGPEKLQRERQAFTESVTFNGMSQRLNASMDDAGALRQFLTALPEAKDLDPAKKNILESKAMTLITRLDNKALAAENRRLNQLKVLGDKLEGRIAMGVPIADSDLVTYQQAAKGTIFEESANGLADEQKAVAALLRKTPAEQAAFVGQLEQHLVTTGEGNPKLVGRLKRTVQSTIQLLNQNPLQYAMDRGGAQVEPLDLAKPESWDSNLSNRTQILTAQAKQVGGTMGALFPQEAAALAHVMQSGTPDQKKAFLEPLRRGLADDNVFRSTIQQVAKDSPVTALAAMISTREAPLTSGRIFKDSYLPGDTSAKLLRGESMLNPTKGQKAEDGKTKGFPMPHGADEQAMRTRFSDTAGEVFAGAPDAFDVQYQAARAYYAATVADKGDFSASLDSTAWAQSIAATMPIGKFNGKAVLMPWGMDEGRFKDRVTDAFPQALKVAGLPIDMAGATGRYTLQNVTGNRYLVRQGTEYLTGPKGRVTIEVPELPTSYLSPAKRAARFVPQ